MITRKIVFICNSQFTITRQIAKDEKKPDLLINSRNGNSRFHALGFCCASGNSFYVPTDSIFGTTLIDTTTSTPDMRR
jgi:hypothetical protein